MFFLGKLKVKNLVMGLLLINSMDFIYASNNVEHYDDNILTLKQNLSDNFIKNGSKLKDSEVINDINNNDSSQYAKKIMNNTGNRYVNCKLDNLRHNKNNNKESAVKIKYTKLNNQLQMDNGNIKLLNNAGALPVDRLSLNSNNLLNASYSNPVEISDKNKQQRWEDYLNKHNDILPVITIQADGLQVLDSIAQLMAFNDFYNINNFGIPYIYCASSASVVGLSIAMDLQKSKDPSENLIKIGNTLSQAVETAVNDDEESNEENNDNKNKCCCSCNCFKLVWLKIFGCCISYNEGAMIDSFYKMIPAATLNSIITESLQLNSSENLDIPNLVIKDVNSNTKIIEQVTSANRNQNKKAIKIQVKLFADPLLLLIKKFANKVIGSSDANKAIQYGIEKAEDKMKKDDLAKITDQDEINFIGQKHLHDEDIDRLLLILASNVDNNSTIKSDANGVNIECNALKFDGISEPLHTIKINLYTANSLTNPNYSLESKYNTFKDILSNSEEFMSLIDNLPHAYEKDSIDSNNINNENGEPGEEKIDV